MTKRVIDAYNDLQVWLGGKYRLDENGKSYEVEVPETKEDWETMCNEIIRLNEMEVQDDEDLRAVMREEAARIAKPYKDNHIFEELLG